MSQATGKTFKKVKSDELKEGREVAFEKRIVYGWNAYYRHRAFVKTTVKRITPKRTKAVLGDGTEVSLRGGFVEPTLYEYDESMAEETRKARMFAEGKRLLCRIKDEVSAGTLAALDDEDMAEVLSALRLIAEKRAEKRGV